MKRELEYIRDCLNRAGSKFGWGDVSDWTSHNFEALSNDIERVTHIAISSRTLRRLTNNKVQYNPQIATKNALAIYTGYRDWNHFLEENAEKEKVHVSGNQQKSVVQRYFLLLLVSIVAVLIIFFVFFYPSVELELNKSRVVFYSNDMKGTAPHKASFFYDVSKIKSSNIFIDKNFYDHGELIPVKKNMHFFNLNFDLPDYYAVKVIANGERLSCVGVHVLTNSWQAIVNNKLILNLTLSNDSGIMHIPSEELQKLNINTDSIVRMGFRDIRDFGITGDDMTFETRFRNSAAEAGPGCFDSKIELINTHGRLSFNFIMPGCDEEMLEAEFGDIYLTGAFNDLNIFYQDVSYWRVLKIVTKKKRVGVYLDDVQIYSIRYNDPLDDVKGIAFNFVGSGAVDYVKLYNEDMELVYNEDFIRRNQ